MERKLWERPIQFRPKGHDLQMIEFIKQQQEEVNPMRKCTVADAIRLALYQVGMQIKNNADNRQEETLRSKRTTKRSKGSKAKSPRSKKPS